MVLRTIFGLRGSLTGDLSLLVGFFSFPAFCFEQIGWSLALAPALLPALFLMVFLFMQSLLKGCFFSFPPFALKQKVEPKIQADSNGPFFKANGRFL